MGDGRCMECRAQLSLSNCGPAVNPCEQCGRCECLARPWVEEGV